MIKMVNEGIVDGIVKMVTSNGWESLMMINDG